MLSFGIAVLVATVILAAVVVYKSSKSYKDSGFGSALPALIVMPLVTMRYRAVLWVLVAIPIIGVLFFGYKSSGYYQGYAAGSVFDPKTYEETAVTRTFGSDIGLSANELNKRVGMLRSKNLGMIFVFLAVLLLVAILLLVLALVMTDVVAEVCAKFAVQPQLKTFFIEQYEKDNGPYSPNDVESKVPIKLSLFASEYLLSKERWSVENKPPLETELEQKLSAIMETVKGKVFLLFQGRKLSGSGYLEPLF
ncbi:hypothetical protein [Bifidobacterium sp. ESL0745]|uniref:hypothetical protein n=1 Tax=Bifidobacterium sp. ESL0745 TaxID=2983226 RepID=UPI0023F856F0|nr:hypothetical protein [Bifidobacterium sp. ESL0745]MDF7664884.1 hypothetical protein [Bifidobacterium sp. ESL0745]